MNRTNNTTQEAPLTQNHQSSLKKKRSYQKPVATKKTLYVHGFFRWFNEYDRLLASPYANE